MMMAKMLPPHYYFTYLENSLLSAAGARRGDLGAAAAAAQVVHLPAVHLQLCGGCELPLARLAIKAVRGRTIES
jgi:hypothetical protein